MTRFNKEDFTWDGMYLMYRGAHTKSVMMEVARPDCHPSWIGKPQPTFIARFKYGSKPYKSWINFLVKNATVEQYVDLAEKTSPVEAMATLRHLAKNAKSRQQRGAFA
jgi:hypothetical protein